MDPAPVDTSLLAVITLGMASAIWLFMEFMPIPKAAKPHVVVILGVVAVVVCMKALSMTPAEVIAIFWATLGASNLNSLIKHTGELRDTMVK